MAKIKTQEQLQANIEKAKTEIRQGENYVKQLKRGLAKEERKARTSRLIQRGAIAESLIKNSDELTNEQFQSILAAGLHTDKASERLEHFRRIKAEKAAGMTPDAQ